MQSPIGALVVAGERDETAVLHAAIVDPAGRQLLRASHALDGDTELIGVRLANELRALGASRILDAVRGTERISAPQPD